MAELDLDHDPEHLDDETLSVRQQLVYGLHDKPPLLECLFVAVQHTFAIFVPVITPGLIICNTLKIDPVTSSYIAGMSLFVSGIASFIQAKKFGPVGTGLLTIQGTSFSYVAPLIAAGLAVTSKGGTPQEALSLLLGLSFFGSFVMIFLSRLLDYTKKIFPPLVTGIVVTCIGLTLIKVGITDMAGGFSTIGTDGFASPMNVALSMGVFFVVTFCSVSSNRFLRMGSIVVGLIAGYIVSLALGLIDFSTLKGLPLLNVPIPFKFGIRFDWLAFIPVAFVYIASMLECIGDITATCMVTGEPVRGSGYFRRIKAGVLGDGLNSLLASVLGTFPVTTMSQNNGLIKLTGVGSRYVGFYLSGVLILLGLFPIVGGFMQLTPAPVLGGATILMFGSIAVSGFNILRSVEMDTRASVVVAVSLSMALGVTFLPEFVAKLPPLLAQVFESGISTGAIFALVLNLLLPGKKTVPESVSESSESVSK